MSESERDRTAGVPGVLDAVRDGWHSLGGGDSAACPGCPVCRLSESAGRMDPETAAHLQQAVGHVVSAGRELLAALTGPGRSVPRDDDAAATSRSGRAATGTGTTGTSTAEAPGAADDRSADPPTEAVPVRTRIPVHTPTERPRRGNEEQQ